MKAISGLIILIFSRFCKLIWDDVERNIKVFTLWQDWLLLAYEIDDLFNPSFLIYFNNSNTFMVNLPIVKIRCFFSGLLKWLLITREDYSLWQETGESEVRPPQPQQPASSWRPACSFTMKLGQSFFIWIFVSNFKKSTSKSCKIHQILLTPALPQHWGLTISVLHIANIQVIKVRSSSQDNILAFVTTNQYKPNSGLENNKKVNFTVSIRVRTSQIRNVLFSSEGYFLLVSGKEH